MHSNASQSHLLTPMPWSFDELARITNGQWIYSNERHTLEGYITGIDASRQTRTNGSAIVVRTHKYPQGILPSAMRLRNARALITDDDMGVAYHQLPTLRVAHIESALLQLACVARKRLQGQVVAVSGITGKTSCIHMLKAALQQAQNENTTALLQQRASVQLINAQAQNSVSFIEVPLSVLAQKTAMIAPDILLITNLNETGNGCDSLVQEHIIAALPAMPSNATVLLPSPHSENADIQAAAKEKNVRLISFDSQALANRKIQMQITTTGSDSSDVCDSTVERLLNMALPKESDALLSANTSGKHMARNACASLVCLRVIQINEGNGVYNQHKTNKCEVELEIAHHQQAMRLITWRAPAHFGTPQFIPTNSRLFDHSRVNSQLAIQAAFAHFKDLTCDAQNRVVIVCLSSFKAYEFDLCMDALCTTIESTPIHALYLWGEDLAGLPSALSNHCKVTWFADMEVLAEKAIANAQVGDDFLLVGGGLLSQSIISHALREMNHHLPVKDAVKGIHL